MANMIRWEDVRMFYDLYNVRVSEVEERLKLPTGTLSRFHGFDPRGYPSHERWVEIRDAVLTIDAERQQVRDSAIERIVALGNRTPARA